ncbi:MAG TPA: hypothetical protein VK209_08485 [Candidatus Sulfotelmatobacter sp.]|nr:hypothetical protein [Candidatus Sulfotelmatobacter sp.]
MCSLKESTLHINMHSFDTEKVSIPISQSLTLNIYSSNKPHNLKIAELQKGLILTYNGIQLVGEGAGFGLPVIVCPEETFFSGSAKVTISIVSGLVRIVKEFSMDRVLRNKFGKLQLENRQVRSLLKYLAGLYQNNQSFRSVLFREFMTNLRIKSSFEKKDTVGKISVTYEVSKNNIKVQVDLSGVKTQYRKEIFILNEQSSHFFRKYSDSQGTTLTDNEIGAWNNSKGQYASFTDVQDRFGFRVWQAEGAILRYGREVMRNHLDWIGLDFEVNPKKDIFEYKVDLLGANLGW